MLNLCRNKSTTLRVLLLQLILCSCIACGENLLPGEEVTPESIRAIQKGLSFLAANQGVNGAWYADVGYKLNTSYKVTRENVPHIGITALACMAFMAYGNLPDRGPYGRNVKKGLAFILSCVREDTGYITRYGTRMYSHAFATLFLAEIYGMTHRQNIRAKLEKAVNLIASCQNREGGWRYEPNAEDADMSITVCQVQALRAARNIGIKVPKKCIERAIDYIRQSATWKGGFKYQLLTMRDTRVSFALTAAGVTALYGTGVYQDAALQRGLNYLMNPPPGDAHPPCNHYFYYYGHYYAVQAMYMAGTPYWEQWFPRIRNELVRIQNPDGSWQDNTGKLYPTAIATIILEIPYRYLPIFQR